jgi:diguanylate cyclase (GGDEF)-like protein
MYALLHGRSVASIATAVLGTLATVGLFLLVCSWDYQVAEIDFQSKAKSYVEVINADLSDADTLPYTIAAFIGANRRPVTADAFLRFSSGLHHRVAGLRDTAWAPRVSLGERAALERDAQAQGLRGFEIRQFGRDRVLVRASPRPKYFPLLYIEAGGAKRSVLGFDLISDTLRSKTILRALRTGRPAATPPIDVMTVAHRGAGIVSYMPVDAFERGAAGRQIRGIVVGVFDVPVMVESILAAKPSVGAGLKLSVYDPAPRAGHRILFQTPSGAAAPEPIDRLLTATHWSATVHVIDQNLGAVVTPAVPLRFVRWTFFEIMTLAAGLTMTATIVAYLVMSARRTKQLEALTASLRATTVTLHDKAEIIAQMLRTDALTGMANRRMFTERIDEAILQLQRGAPFALLFFDLDRFKNVNDTLGHSAGDTLLCRVAERIRPCVRESDTAARLGGDEFAIILSPADDAEAIGAVANRLLQSIGEPYDIGGRTVTISVSIGATLAADGMTADAIVAAADVAMYAAKDAGRGTFRYFEVRRGSPLIAEPAKSA